MIEEEQPKPEEEAKEQHIDYKDAWLRSRADYENLKRETAEQRTTAGTYAKAAILIDLVPVIAHFKQALKFIPAEQQALPWVIGIKQIQKLLEDFMGRHDMKLIEAVGKPFDAKFHEAVGKRKAEDAKPDMVLEEVSPGYLLGGEVIQPAKVIVAE
ncbi:MAG: nucleotide exchange factor GrpE [Parcubacteria group bacterium]|nr:nucleotide exchange factor GrpE [Parcubacteria group bacterium]